MFLVFSQENGGKVPAVSIITNCYQVDELLYRSAQPSHSDMRVLFENGVKSVLNLRSFQNDIMELRDISITPYRYAIVTRNISYQDLVESLKIINKAPKPLLVHCKFGSDRTGFIIAGYRMIYNNWTKEKAIEEFLKPELGYHQNYFPNLLELLKSVDVEQLRKDVEGNSIKGE